MLVDAKAVKKIESIFKPISRYFHVKIPVCKNRTKEIRLNKEGINTQ
jgi:hypothetical protein